MYDNISLIFNDQILKRFQEFRKIKRTSRHTKQTNLISCASDLSIALFHFREHFKKVKSYSRGEVESLCSSYGLIGDVCNAVKHVTLSNPTPHGAPIVSGASSIHEGLVAVGFKDAEGVYWHSEFCVSLEIPSRPGEVLDNHLVEVYNFWRDQVETHCGINFPKFRRFYMPGSRFIDRSRARNAAQKIVQGLPFSGRLQIMLYDDLLGYAVPFPVARNIGDFTTSILEISIEFEDEKGSPEKFVSKTFEKEMEVDNIIDKIGAIEEGTLESFKNVLKQYGIDINSELLKKYGSSINGRQAQFHVQKMQSLKGPAGKFEVVRMGK